MIDDIPYTINFYRRSSHTSDYQNFKADTTVYQAIKEQMLLTTTFLKSVRKIDKISVEVRRIIRGLVYGSTAYFSVSVSTP